MSLAGVICAGCGLLAPATSDVCTDCGRALLDGARIGPIERTADGRWRRLDQEPRPRQLSRSSRPRVTAWLVFGLALIPAGLALVCTVSSEIATPWMRSHGVQTGMACMAFGAFALWRHQAQLTTTVEAVPRSEKIMIVVVSAMVLAALALEVGMVFYAELLPAPLATYGHVAPAVLFVSALAIMGRRMGIGLFGVLAVIATVAVTFFVPKFIRPFVITAMLCIVFVRPRSSGKQGGS